MNAAPPTLNLSAIRHDTSDLEVSGNIPGVPTGSTRFIAYDELLRLPQVSFKVAKDDDNFESGFPSPTVVSGVSLETLARTLSVSLAEQMPVALCSDGYRANYPTEYIAAHHPVLVLRINGQPPSKWPQSHYGDSMSPYLISHDNFKSSFRILSHEDEPQVPYAVVNIEFRNEHDTFAAIAPPGHYAPDSPEMEGYRIVKQNCFRCHNNGTAGGTMSHHPWQVLAAWAAYQPDYFTQYVLAPASLRKNARMPGNPQYDQSTIDAIRRYFVSFAATPNPSPKGRQGQ